MLTGEVTVIGGSMADFWLLPDRSTGLLLPYGASGLLEFDDIVSILSVLSVAKCVLSF
jgi:hypothetical protein